MGQIVEADYSRWHGHSLPWHFKPRWDKPKLVVVFDSIGFINCSGCLVLNERGNKFDGHWPPPLTDPNPFDFQAPNVAPLARRFLFPPANEPFRGRAEIRLG